VWIYYPQLVRAKELVRSGAIGVAVGDGENDIPMFQAVGTRVAMGNGSDRLKAVAHALAPPCEDDGAANVVHRILSAKAKRESE
jgi:phosphoserine phosphatase